MSVAAVVYKWGGAHILHRDVTSELDLAEMVREGLRSGALDHVLDTVRDWTGSQAVVLDIVGRRRTLERRTGGKEAALQPAESDRLARLLRVIVRAEEAIGNTEKAHRWLMKPNGAAGDRIPLKLLDSDAGSLAVEQVLGRIEYGVYS